MSASETTCSCQASAEAAFFRAFTACPIIPVLRPLPPERAIEVAETLLKAGLRLIEIPLNGEKALETLKILAETMADRLVIGAGTVLSVEDVEKVHALGLSFVLSPNMRGDVIRATRKAGMVSVPGVATPTEAFDALSHGATALKAFPGAVLTPEAIKAWKTVLPKGVAVIVSGGITAANCGAYFAAGADGFGVSSALYKATLPAEEIYEKAASFVQKVMASCPAAKPEASASCR